MDNTTFKELLDAGEVDLIMADGAQALSKKQLGTIIQRTQESIGRNIPDTMKLKTKSISNLRLEEVKQNPFFSPVGKTKITKLKKGDSIAAILAKMFNFMKQMYEEKQLQKELDRDFAKQRERETARQEKKPVNKKTKGESRLKNFAKNMAASFKNTFDKLFKFLAKAALVALIFEIDKEVDKVVEDFTKLYDEAVKLKKSIVDGIDKIKNWFKSIDIFGYKPFDFGDEETKPSTEEPTATPIKPTTPMSSDKGITKEAYRRYVGSLEGGALGYNALYGYYKATDKNGKDIRPRYNGKLITELTLSEALQFSRSIPGNRGAIGQYGFLPTSLKQAIDDSGLPMSAPFNETNQDLLADVLTESNRKDLKQRLNREPTFEDLRIAHYTGARGYSQLLAAEQKGSTETVMDIRYPKENYKTSQEKEQRQQIQDTNPAFTKPVSKFLSDERASFQKYFKIQPPSSSTPTDTTSKPVTQTPTTPKINSEKLTSISKNNENLKDEMVSSNIVINNMKTNNIIGTNQKTQIIDYTTPLDLPLFLQGQR